MKRTILEFSTWLLISVGAVLAFFKAGYRNIDAVKSSASKVWGEAGYEIVAYEGYQVSPVLGGKVWYQVRRRGDGSITYQGFLAQWGGEVHIYNFKAIDAITPR